MQQQNSPNQLTLTQREMLLGLLDNRDLKSALRVVWQARADSWLTTMQVEAINGSANPAKITEYAARAAECMQFEDMIRKALDL